MLAYLSRENSKTDKDYSDTDRIDRYWYLPRDKRPKYPELPNYRRDTIYFGYSEDSRSISNHFGYINGPHSVTGSVQFFIEEERKHFRLLNTYVFEPLSIISTYHLSAVFGEDDVFPKYTAPTYSHYEEAVLHMKKDKTNLDLLMAGMTQDITKFNEESGIANTEIRRLISSGINEVGFTNILDIKDINGRVRHYLKHNIYRAEDISKQASEFTASMAGESLSEGTRNTIITLVRDHGIEIERNKR